MEKVFDLWDRETKKPVRVEATRKGQEWKALCPKHQDKVPSLSINDQKRTYHCFSCHFSGPLYDPSRDPANKKHLEPRKIVAVYDYQDQAGNPLFQTVRYDPKDFCQRRPDGNGAWIWDLKRVQTVLYRLPDILKSEEVIIVEGEKDADNLKTLHFCATTCPMGAGKWHQHYNEALRSKDVILCPDNDPAGREHMVQVAISLNGISRSLKWIDLPGLPHKGDVSDWITGFEDPDEARERLAIMIENAPPYTPPKKESQTDENKELSYLSLNLPSSFEISQLDIKVEWVVENLIPKEAITLLHSIGGVGKSYLMYQMAKKVADNEVFFGLPVMQMPVYYIDYENPLPEIVDRMRKLGGSNNLKIWHLGHDPMPIRFDADEWKIYKTFPPGLFIIDSLRSSYMDEENSSKVASFIMGRLKEIRALGSTFCIIHHESKTGSYRGSTAWFDLSDHILKFSRVRELGSDKDVDEDNFNLPIRLGLGGKSRFSSAMDLKPMFFKFEDNLLVHAESPEQTRLVSMQTALILKYKENGQEQNQKDLITLIQNDGVKIGKNKVINLLEKGEGIYWRSRVDSKNKNQKLYSPIFGGS